MPRPLSIHFRDEDLLDLKARLSHIRWSDQPAAAGGRQASDLLYMSMQALVAHSIS